MMSVKNENKMGDITTHTRGSKPLETLGLRDFGRSYSAGTASQDPGAAAGSARLEQPRPARTASGFSPDDIAMMVGVIATALLLTYGNGLMEILFRILGI